MKMKELQSILHQLGFESPTDRSNFIAAVSAISRGQPIDDDEEVNQVSDAPVKQPERPAQSDSGFKFGKGSLRELEGVDNRLVLVTQLALRHSTQDFVVYDGLRTVREQQLHVKSGTSRTMNSKHLQGLAVDLVPWIQGKPVWDWNGCYKIAMAMDQAATELGFAHLITWGGAWDRKLSDFGGDASAFRKEVEHYRVRHAGKDFIDGPHFEIEKG
jgi:peptidoglycan L-alanyl-D-glutamate endopeptidase CwlK